MKNIPENQKNLSISYEYYKKIYEKETESNKKKQEIQQKSEKIEQIIKKSPEPSSEKITQRNEKNEQSKNPPEIKNNAVQPSDTMKYVALASIVIILLFIRILMKNWF